MPSTIHEGSSGPDVELAQYELCRDFLLAGGNPIDGEFGAQTATAVRTFQGNHHLSVDGVVGPASWSAMLGEHRRPPILQIGASGPEVVRLQEFLNLFSPGLDPLLALDGEFGARTRTAVQAFQREVGLASDGIVGYRTLVRTLGSSGRTVASEIGIDHA
jgi:peptidoglycan hydrolase-like protein with peptidoglycan-binding domain